MREGLAPMRRHAALSIASPGLARGVLWVLAEPSARSAASPVASRTLLEEALAEARRELAELQSKSADDDAAQMLEFQIAMLEDDTLLLPAWQAIAEGKGVALAWQHAIDLQLNEYVHAEDPYFRARSADLRDMGERVLRCLSGEAPIRIPAGSIVLARDLAPSTFLETDWTAGGIALREGSSRSHVAMLARSRNVPLLIGVGDVATVSGELALLDAEHGELIVAPDAPVLNEFVARLASIALPSGGPALMPVRSANGEIVKLLINVADGRELDGLSAAEFDGIGLVRTELLLRTRAELADEERQYAAYCAMVRWAAGRPVVIRTLDAGADKPIPGYTLDEANAFLGTRGVRLSLAAPGPLHIQLRAIARAAALGPVRVMVPMVTLPSEMDAVRRILKTVLAELSGEGRASGAPELGMMVEVPLAALSIADFDVDFFSIGSNDLVQYLSAASRESGRLTALQDPLHPAVLRLIGDVVRHANARKIDVSLCGDMASDPRCVPALLQAGLRALSVAPASHRAVRAAIALCSTATGDASSN